MADHRPADQVFLADCQARLAFDLIGNTWNAVLLWALREGPCRPVELRGRIGGISPKVLTETLRRLEYNGLVTRRTYAEAPPRVEYGLSPLGRSMLGPIEAFGEWAFQHADAVMAAQERAEAGAAEDRAARAAPPGSGTRR
ncbi:HxlR family transcriptional regulator [Sphaerisporangium rufum]|uniref:HxlR family transcriptional regulator n=1 Tax=Sphaerisporangium rufum TaxID=1381558 RepID=A0A919V0L0_9ACTN|nr:helix-turn-helix domain-containing protein [Sphaerisporangium rufum]GII76813.1 HxlR family transcriptional regulator [Sphaerisporangium rufum]